MKDTLLFLSHANRLVTLVAGVWVRWLRVETCLLSLTIGLVAYARSTHEVGCGTWGNGA